MSYDSDFLSVIRKYVFLSKETWFEEERDITAYWQSIAYILIHNV